MLYLIVLGFVGGVLVGIARLVKQRRLARQVSAAGRAEQGLKPWGRPLMGGAHGTAYFLETRQIAQAGLTHPILPLRDDVPYLGGHFDTDRPNPDTVRLYYPRDGHLLTVAPTRSGKGVSHVIPNLLTYAGSTVVIDIKGENLAITCRHRKELGPVYAFAPFNPEIGGARFNPIDFIRPGPDGFDDALLIADMLVAPTGSKNDDFWDSEARSLIAGILLYIAGGLTDELRTLTGLRRILTMEEDVFRGLMTEMAAYGLGAVKRTGTSILGMDSRVLSNVLSTARNKTRFLDSEHLDKAMACSDFRFEDLKQGTATIYLVIPPDRLVTYWGLLRLMVGLGVSAMTRTPPSRRLPVLFLLDEFPQLRRMSPIEEGVRYLAGYGVRLWIFTQDIPALKAVYGAEAASSLIANCGCRVFFGTNDFDTAKLVSDMTGQMTSGTITHGQSHGDRDITGSQSQNVSLHGRPLLSPDEVMQLPSTKQLIFCQGERPIVSLKERYFEMLGLEGRADTWGAP